MVARRLLTQLQISPGGKMIGLRYEALPLAMEVEQVPRADWPGVMDAVQVVERYLVRELNKNG